MFPKLKISLKCILKTVQSLIFQKILQLAAFLTQNEMNFCFVKQCCTIFFLVKHIFLKFVATIFLWKRGGLGCVMCIFLMINPALSRFVIPHRKPMTRFPQHFQIMCLRGLLRLCYQSILF